MEMLRSLKRMCKDEACCNCEIREECFNYEIEPFNWHYIPNGFDYQAMINHFGEEAQIQVTQEELAELIQSLSKSLRKGKEKARPSVLEEVADVMLCLEYIKIIFNLSEQEIQQQVKFKQDRLLKGGK